MYILKIDYYDNGNVSYAEHATMEEVNESLEFYRIAYPSMRYSIYQMI
jgi:hypothetical protein